MNPRVRFASREDNTRYLFDGSRRQSGGKVISQVALRQWLQDSCSIGMPTICSKQPEEESWSRGVSAFYCLFVIRMNECSIVSSLFAWMDVLLSLCYLHEWTLYCFAVIRMNERSIVSSLFAWKKILLSLCYSHGRKYYCLFVICMKDVLLSLCYSHERTSYCVFTFRINGRSIASSLFAWMSVLLFLCYSHE